MGSLGDWDVLVFILVKTLVLMVMLGQLQQTIRNFSKIKTTKKYGSLTKHEHKYVGFNSRLDTIQQLSY